MPGTEADKPPTTPGADPPGGTNPQEPAPGRLPQPDPPKGLLVKVCVEVYDTSAEEKAKR